MRPRVGLRARLGAVVVEPGMSRKELRAAIESTWVTYTPRVPGTPFRKKDLEDAQEERPEAPSMQPSEALMRGLIGRLSR